MSIKHIEERIKSYEETSKNLGENVCYEVPNLSIYKAILELNDKIDALSSERITSSGVISQ